MRYQNSFFGFPMIHTTLPITFTKPEAKSSLLKSIGLYDEFAGLNSKDPSALV